ncbi:Crp/Fnr family transcriptional regulator [Azonexus sp.]|jgi:CRP/FNR family transcriptional regulator, dissimilatory nitrate respiration regulator|uniref:Crp/Fnr family transcriptional regulator n=1 Tax=Azonexus sp. TaxID=1872668 RepID=UPI0027BAE46F|nr:Crp/Fnr family transcriptional regulator [Azonexus sp.]
MQNPSSSGISVPTQSSAAEILARTPLFCDLPIDDRQRLAQGCRLESYDKGNILFHKGDPCHGFHLVIEGQIKLAFVSASGHQKVVEIIPPGKSFGEAVMFMQKPYILMAQALTDCQLLFITKDVILQEIRKDSDFCMRLIGGLSMRLHQLIKDLEIYSLCSGRERIVGYLLGEMADDEGNPPSGRVEVCLPTHKATIASRLNLTQEHFSRILHELADDGLIKVEGRRIIIPDVANLHSSLCLP